MLAGDGPRLSGATEAGNAGQASVATQHETFPAVGGGNEDVTGFGSLRGERATLGQHGLFRERRTDRPQAVVQAQFAVGSLCFRSPTEYD